MTTEYDQGHCTKCGCYYLMSSDIAKADGCVVSAMSDELFWSFMCMCYLVGGITIGYYFGQWKNRKKKTGTGRWDYKDRHLP